LEKNPKKKYSIKNKLFAHLEAWRLYTVIWCGLVSLSGCLIAFNINRDFPSIEIAFLAFIIPMIGWTAGLYLSDYLDRNLDAIQKPHRPIPSGRITPNEALIVGGIFAVVGFILSFILGVNNVLLVFIVALLVFLYARISKSRGLMGNINRGIVTVAAYFFGVFSANLSIKSIPLYIWLLSIVFLIHDTNSNLVGAIRDIEGDKKGGYKTIPVKYGIKKSVFISLILTIVWFSLVIYIPYSYSFVKNIFYFVIIFDLIILLSLYIFLFRSIGNYSRQKALKYHEFFVIERITLACAFIFGIINFYQAFSIYLISIIITFVSQYLLRNRYEFQGNI